MAFGNLVLVGATMAWLTPLWLVAAGGIAVSLLLFLIAKVLEQIVPKVVAIARTTAKEAVSQPLFFVLLAIGIFALLLFPFVSYNTLGEDLKMLKTEGLTVIKILAIILAVWTASVSIADELEGRTALTLLSKPVGRRQLIFGKFLGVLVPVAILFIILGMLFLGSVSYKVVYDARETGQIDVTWRQCAEEIGQVAPGLVVSFLEATVLASISVAISTRLSMLPNLIICFCAYVLGHLVPQLVGSPMAAQFPLVAFMGKLIAAILPVLDLYNMESPISTGKILPPMYLLGTALYSFLYCAMSMLVALLLFEDRDLA